MIHFFRFLISKAFIINLILALLLVCGLVYGTLRYLDQYTLHGSTIEVPDLSGYMASELEDVVPRLNLNYVIADSIYIKGKKPTEVLDQDPEAGRKVKKDRKIYVTVNAHEPPKVKVPKLKDLSVRQALSLMETFGLVAGEIIPRPDPCNGCILEAQIDGEPIEEGIRVLRGTVIDLEIGQGLSDELVSVPYLLQQQIDNAKENLKLAGLNVGRLDYDSTVKTAEDSSKAYIYNQRPYYSEEPSVNMGSMVNLYFTMDTTRIIHSVIPTKTDKDE